MMESWKDDQADEDQYEDSVNGFGGKDAILFMIEVHTSSMVSSSDNEDTPLQKALKCVHSTLRRNILGSPNDPLGVLLVGTENNYEVKDFEHMSLVLPMDTPEKKHIQAIEEMVINPSVLQEKTGSVGQARPGHFSLHEALWQCQSLFNDINGKVNKKKIIFFTAQDHPHEHDKTLERQAKIKANDLHENGIILEVIPMVEHFNFERFYVDVVTKDDTEDSLTLAQENKHQQSLEDLLKMVRRKTHKKRSIGKCYLELGHGVKMAVATYNFVQKATKPTKVRLARDTNEEVKIQRTFIDHKTGAPLLPSDIAKSIEYGGTKVSFTQDEIRSMQKATMHGFYGLRLVAFRPTESFPWGALFVRSSHFLYPDEQSIKGSRNMFAALHQRCLERQVYALCSYKPREASIPSFVALHAQAEETDLAGAQRVSPGFLMYYLAFSDDIRDVPASHPSIEVSENQLEIARKVCKKLKMKFYAHDAFENPSLQAHFKLIESLALLEEDEEDSGIDYTLPPIDRQRSRLGNLSDEFNQSVQPSVELSTKMAANKRPATSNSYYKSQAYKKPRVENTHGGGSINDAEMLKLVKASKVESLKVADLKSFVRTLGKPVSNKVKAELVGTIYDHFSYMNK